MWELLGGLDYRPGGAGKACVHRDSFGVGNVHSLMNTSSLGIFFLASGLCREERRQEAELGSSLHPEVGEMGKVSGDPLQTPG